MRPETRKALEREILKRRIMIGAGAVVFAVAALALLSFLESARPVPDGYVTGQIVEIVPRASDGSGSAAEIRVDVDGRIVPLASRTGDGGMSAGDTICLLRLRRPTSGAVSYDRALASHCSGA